MNLQHKCKKQQKCNRNVPGIERGVWDWNKDWFIWPAELGPSHVTCFTSTGDAASLSFPIAPSRKLKQSFQVNQWFTFTSNLVHCDQRFQCGHHYIGKTKHSFEVLLSVGVILGFLVACLSFSIPHSVTGLLHCQYKTWSELEEQHFTILLEPWLSTHYQILHL